MARAARLVAVAFVLSGYFLILAPIGYTVFALWTLFPTRDRERRTRFFQRIVQLAFACMHVILRYLKVIHFDPSEIEGTIPREPCVLVGNHPTLVDISSIVASEPNLVFPVKPAVFDTWWGHPLLAAAGQFETATSSPSSVQRVVEEAVDRLQRGYRVVMFPEGTRSPPDRMLPFGRMAFEIAARAGVPVVPLVFECEPRYLTREAPYFARMDRVPRLTIKALPPVDPNARGSSSRDVRDTVYELIRRELDAR